MKPWLFAVAAVLFAYATANAQGSPCGPVDALTNLLVKQYSEIHLLDGTAPGPNNSGLLPIKMFANPITGSWSIIMISPDGKNACITMAGEGLRPARKPGVDS